MFCKNCGSSFPDGQNFCPVCGAAAEKPVAVNAAQPTNASYQQNAAYPVNQPQYATPSYPQQQYAQPQYPQQPQYAQPQYAQPQYAQLQYAQQPYGQPQYPAYQRPVLQLATNRKLVKYIFFNILTFGIYGLVYFTNISNSINAAASRYDGRKTMNYCLVAFIFSWLTCGIVPFVWIIKLSARIGNELKRRNINYSFGAGQFWLWCFLGSLFIVGPFIYIHKLSVAMNLICKDYNMKG